MVTTEPYNRRGEQPDGSLYPEDDPDRVDEWNTLLRRVIGQRPNVTVLDLNKKLGPNGYYTTKVNGIRMRIDGVHPTPEAVKWLTPWLTDALKRSDFGALIALSDDLARRNRVSGRGGRGQGAAAASPGPCRRGRARCSAR